MPQIKKIVLVTIERDTDKSPEFDATALFPNGQIAFKPLVSKQNQPLLLNKLDDFVRFPNELGALVRQEAIQVIVARGAPAGALAYLVWTKLKTPFLVESFEPHADYMLESGVWKKFDPRFIFEKYWEYKQKKLAVGLMPVAENYRQQLIGEGVPPARIVAVPCSVNLDMFAFRAAQRTSIREQLGIAADATVGIYVGKFGGMYYETEAFALFQAAASFFGESFRLIILTPTPADVIQSYLRDAGFRPEHVFVTKAPPTTVPAYLAAADFAFATYKKGSAKRFLSPIKVGEYWAVGLPVLLTEGVGDDSEILKNEGGGAVFDVANPATVQTALARIQALLREPNHREHIRKLAERYRSIAHARQAYEQLLLPLAGR